MKVKVDLPTFVVEILKKFDKAGFEIYVVGGAVRDILTNREVDDWDFTTNATPPEILKVFPEGFYDNQFGTVGIAHESSPNPYEITTFRTEHGYSDARRPDKVEWGKTLEEDLVRRDFTINAMAIGQVKGERQEVKEGETLFYHLPFTFYLIDKFGGQKDLKNKIIRAVGDPNERFSEDALRLMRAVRIAAELGFTIEEKTFDAIKANASLINKIAKERVRDELLKLLASPNPYDGILVLRNSGLLLEILPEMEKTFGVEQKSPGRHHIYDVGTHSLYSLKAVAEKNSDPIVRLATLIHDIGKPQTYKKLDNGTITFYNHEVVGARMAKQIAERLRLSSKDSEKLWRLVRYHQFTVNENQTDSALRRFIRHVGIENVSDMLDLRVGDRLGGGARETSWRLEEFKKRLVEVQKQPFTVKDLKIDGNDVMKALDIKPGPHVGEILDQLFEEVVEKKIENERNALLKRLEDTK
ncbi:HD domain-containing protein [Candidatus Woesebacteria bacterium]|nr:HD domain-containing protein [Candidatus Woesebacteria bacterium]